MKKLPVLPSMKCDEGCGECCGVILCNDSEFQRILYFIGDEGIQPMEQGTQCPLYQGGKCMVYPVRPSVCRLFGHTEELECPRGYNVNVSGPVKRRYDKFFSKQPRCLHELNGEGWHERLKKAIRMGT